MRTCSDQRLVQESFFERVNPHVGVTRTLPPPQAEHGPTGSHFRGKAHPTGIPRNTSVVVSRPRQIDAGSTCRLVTLDAARALGQ